MAADTLDFDTPRLAEAIDRLQPEQVDALPFGAVRLDASGTVTLHNEAERRQPGYRKDAVGCGFFTNMAPCLDTPVFRGRIERALANRRPDIAFDHTMDLLSGARDVEVRVRVQSIADGGCWIFMQHEG